MVKLRTQTKTLFERIFPERQIYHRSGGTVNYIAVSPLQQCVIALGGTAVAGWLVFATAIFMIGGSSTSLDSNYGRENQRLTRWTQELRAKEALARTLLEERTDAFQRATVDFEERHQTLELLLKAVEGSDDLEITALRGNGASLLVDASIDIADPRQSRVEAETIKASAPEVVGVRAQIDELRARQKQFLDKAEIIAVERTELAQGVLELTSVGINRIGAEQTGTGGPLVDMLSLGTNNPNASPEELAFAERVIQVAARLDEARNLENVVQSLPLASPSSVPIRVTSPYGLRADPFTRRSAWHSGVDMGAGPVGYKVPITAAGPGEVVYAGHKGGYGRVVEIDHGHGFRSRYGHLRRIDVKRGDKVAIGDTLGLMGSSGRSTGRHLHYEVMFQGKPYDPRHFLKAGQHVHEG